MFNKYSKDKLAKLHLLAPEQRLRVTQEALVEHEAGLVDVRSQVEDLTARQTAEPKIVHHIEHHVPSWVSKALIVQGLVIFSIIIERFV